MLHQNILSHFNDSWATSPLRSCSVLELSVYIFSFVLAWNICRAIYLFHFHPLSSFRGPWKAIFSSWWLYSVSKSGQTEQVLERLHKEYNTRALRIAPNEIHISDPSLYHTIYQQRYPFQKQKHFYDGFNTPHSVFAEIDEDVHRERRKMLNNFFSKSSVRSMQRILVSKISSLCRRLSETKGNGPINLYNAFRCLTVDLITEVAFGESFDLLVKADDNTFDAPTLETFDLAAASLSDITYFPILRVIINKTPPAIAVKLSRSAASFQDLLRTVQKTVARFRRFKRSGKSVSHDVAFDAMSHLDDGFLMAEAVDILVAGSDTTATTLAVAVHESIKRPGIWKRLREELEEAGLCDEEKFDLVKLEHLPYLTACVKEAIRYAMAVPGRLPRIVPKGAEPFVVDGKIVPPGTSVGMSAYTVHFDEDIWGKDAKTFNPDRWQAGNAKELDRYLVTFSKGARQCLGINLAYAEITLALAMLAERFRFSRDETLTTSDLKTMDFFTISFEGTGLRAIVQEGSE